MKKITAAFLTFGLIGFACVSPLSAQKKDDKKENREAAAASSLYVISAKAGAVNYVSGKVSFNKKNGKKGNLAKGDILESSDRVKTGLEGKAEILLNPGSYLRLAENSDFKFDSASLDNLQVSLISGSAIFEVITDGKFEIAVNTPKSNYKLVKSGIYRVDALADGAGKMTVWKGRAVYGQGKKDYVKGGQTTAILNGQTTVQKFDKDSRGDFELWSRDRAKEIAAANAKLQQRAMSRSLLSSFSQDPWGNAWSRSNRFGLWVFDPLSRGHCFLPFGYGWSSPYGYGFNRSIWDYRLPNQVYNSINPNWNNINNQQNQGNFPPPASNNGSGISAPPSSGNSNPSPAPPPMRQPIERPADVPALRGEGKFRVQQPIDH